MISLLPNQVEHYERIKSILSKSSFALDFSMLGAGKTYTSSLLALENKYKHVIVICPVSVISKWRHMQKEYDIPIHQILSFQSLRSTKFHQPKHGYLHRRDSKSSMMMPHSWRPNEFTEIEVDQVDFEITDLYRTMVDEGLLLIIDEIQNIKNISTQFKAAQTLIHTITLQNGRPRFEKQDLKSHLLLLSGSPIDKQEHAMHLFRAIGIMTDDRIAQYNIRTGVQEWRGMQQIYDFCYSLNGIATTNVLQRRPWEKFDPYVYRLFQQVFKLRCASSMLPPSHDFSLQKLNAFYNIDQEGAEIIKRGLGHLVTATAFNGNQVMMTANVMASVTLAMQIIETGKIKLLAKLARRDQKTVICVNFTETLKDLAELLKDLNPLILNGSVPEHKRGDIIEKFQRPTSEFMLLLCNQAVVSTGIDLDDKHGGFPRICFVSPNYSTISMYQLAHRFLRADTKSDSQIHMVYAKREGISRERCNDIIELRVLDALGRKSKIMKDTTPDQASAGVVFPGDYEEWEED